ncbi:dephospho-CoA kinase [Limnobacter sp.]|uniref:dephospho-CoA kinase n=1 Tax=Limnobacter sp. TaxID=2003368 RepID=UPI00351813AC
MQLQKPKSPVVGLTGGIGSGKTAVSNRLAALGATVIDTDQIAHALTTPGGAAMDDICRAFGPEAVNADGSMNRALIRALVFNEPAQRSRLENILHPKIRNEVQRQFNAGAPLYFVLVVPLLVEKSGWLDLLDAVLVVDCDPQLQIQRVMTRNGWPASQVQAVMDAQASRSDRLLHATDVLQNNGTLEELNAKIDFLHEKFIKIAQK